MTLTGKGSIVRMIFPVAAERSVLRAPGSVSDLAADAPSEPQTILLVEDSDDVRQVTDSYLRSLGYRVLAAHSGEQALELLDHYGKVDVLFTDVMIPGGMNGLMLVERVRQRIPDLPVLLTIGYIDELAEQGVNTSTFAILAKPYRRTELADRIRSALDKPGKASSQTPPNFRHEG